MATVSVEQVVTESFAYVRRGWRAAPGAMGAAVIVAAAGQAFGQPGPEMSLWLFAQVAAATLATGALYRSILQQAHPGDPRLRLGPAGLQWGKAEWWVLAANLAVGFLMGLVACAFALVWGIGLNALSASHEIDPSLLLHASAGDPAAFSRIMAGPGGILTLAVFLPGVALIIYLWARLILAPILAVDTGRLDLGRAWKLTRGASLALVVALIIIFLGQLLAVLSGGLLGALAASGGADLAGAGLAGASAGAAIATALSLPMTAGAAACVYRRDKTYSGTYSGPWAANEF